MKYDHFPIVERAVEQLRSVGTTVLMALDTGAHNFGQRFLEGAGMPPSPSRPEHPVVPPKSEDSV